MNIYHQHFSSRRGTLCVLDHFLTAFRYCSFNPSNSTNFGFMSIWSTLGLQKNGQEAVDVQVTVLCCQCCCTIPFFNLVESRRANYMPGWSKNQSIKGLKAWQCSVVVWGQAVDLEAGLVHPGPRSKRPVSHFRGQIWHRNRTRLQMLLVCDHLLLGPGFVWGNPAAQPKTPYVGWPYVVAICGHLITPQILSSNQAVWAANVLIQQES